MKQQESITSDTIGKWLFVIFMLVVLLWSCSTPSTITIEKPVPMHDTLFSEHWQIDTTYIERWHTIDRYGDTLWRIDSVIVYKAKHIRDTIREVEETPVEVVRTETIEVEKPLRWWQEALIRLGGLSLIIVLGYIGIKIARKKLHLSS